MLSIQTLHPKNGMLVLLNYPIKVALNLMIMLEILKKMPNDTNSFKYNLLVILGDFSAGKISVMVVRRYHFKARYFHSCSHLIRQLSATIVAINPHTSKFIILY